MVVFVKKEEVRRVRQDKTCVLVDSVRVMNGSESDAVDNPQNDD